MHVPEEVLDGVRELITIGVGRSAGMLNHLTQAHVTLTVPEVEISDGFLENTLTMTSGKGETESRSYTILKFSGELTGSVSLIIPHSSALNLVILLTGEESSPDEMDVLREETLLEVGNIIISAVMSGLGILLTSRLSFQFPGYHAESGDLVRTLMGDASDIAIRTRINFSVHQKEIEGSIIIILTRSSYDNLTSGIHAIMERGL